MPLDIQEANNNAVEHLLMGQPRDAIATLLHALDSLKTDLICQLSLAGAGNANLTTSFSSSSAQMEVDGSAVHLYSVDLCHDFDIEEPAFPVRWYGKPIAITCDGEWGEEDCQSGPMNHDLNLVVVLYNLAISYQLVDAAPKNQDSNLVRRRMASTNAFEAYTLALQALVPIQERMHLSGRLMAPSERFDFGLLHAAVVNNMLFLYAQRADMQGMSTCLSILRQVLAFSCRGLPPCDAEEFAFFRVNAILYPNPGSLSLSPAA